MTEQAPKQHRFRNRLLPLATGGIALGLALSGCRSEKNITSDPTSGAVDRMDTTRQNVAKIVKNGGTPVVIRTADEDAAHTNSIIETVVAKVGKGVAGPVGPKGDPGSKGEKGEKGDRGPQGESAPIPVPTPTQPIPTEQPTVAPTVAPTATATPTETPTPTATATARPPEGLPTPVAEALVLPEGVHKYDFPTGEGANEEVARLRGGDPAKWKRVVEKFTVPIPQTDGTVKAVELEKVEWRYDLRTGSMTDLYPHARIPQTALEAAYLLNGPNQQGNVKPENLMPIRITHDTQSQNYAPWMDAWPVPNDTVVGWHLIENHGDPKNSPPSPYIIFLPSGSTVELYWDNRSVREDDDIASTLWNPDRNPDTENPLNLPLKIVFSGATIWTWGNPEKVSVQQSNYDQHTEVPSAYATFVYEGTLHILLPLRVGSNIASPDAAHRFAVPNSQGTVTILDGLHIPQSTKRKRKKHDSWQSKYPFRR